MTAVPGPECPEAGDAPVAERFFTPGTWVALALVASCVSVSAWRPQVGPGTVSDGETVALVKLQSRLLAGVASVDRGRAVEQAGQLQALAGTPSGARAVASCFLYLRDEALRDEARRLLETLPEESARESDPILRKLAAHPSDPLNEAEREILRREGGWFGDLALAGQDAAAAGRVGAAGRRVILAVGLGFLLFCGAFGTGLILLLAAPWLRQRLRSRMGRVRPAIPERRLVQAFAVYLAVMVGSGWGAAATGWASVPASAIGILAALSAALAWPMLRGARFGELRTELGLHFGTGVMRETAAGVAAYCAALPVVAAGVALTVGLQHLAGRWWDGDGATTPQAVSHPVIALLDGADPKMLWAVGWLAVVQGPFVEEVMFRGALQRGLRGLCGRVGAMAAMAFCFAVIHPQGLLAVPALMGMALAFGWMREWRDSLWPGIVAHGLHNGALLAFSAFALAG